MAQACSRNEVCVSITLAALFSSLLSNVKEANVSLTDELHLGYGGNRHRTIRLT